MIKARAKGKDGRTLVVLGLSDANLDRLRAQGLNGGIKINGSELGIDCDILITSASTEVEITQELARFIGPSTDVKISKRLKQ